MALIAHLRFATSTEANSLHGFRQPSNLLTITNQCPWCLSSFTDQRVAEKHVSRMCETGRCDMDRAYIDHHVITPKSLECKVCGESAADVAQAQ